jgi:RND superfamily putative drug exporter
MVRWRWVVLVGWVAVIAAILSTGIPSFGRDGLSLEELASPDSPEVQTELDSLRLFKVPLNAREQVVRRDAAGLPAEVRQQDVAAAIAGSRDVQQGTADSDVILLQLPITNVGGAFPSSRESATTTINNLFGNPERSLTSQVREGNVIADEARERGGGEVNLTGGIPAQLRTGQVVRESLDGLQTLSIIVLAAITLLWFRSLAPMVIVLTTIGVTMIVMLEALAQLTERFGIGVPAEVLPVVLVVAIGVASDYALFHVAAWSRFVQDGMSPAEATVRAITTNSSVVLTAGATTSLGAASLLLAKTPFVQAFAPALIVAILVAVLVGLLLVPALVAVFGSKLLWPRRPRSRPAGRRPASARLARLVARPRAATGIVAFTVLALVLLGASARSAPLGFNVITALPSDDPIVLGARDAGEGFAPGILSPTLLLIDGEQLDERSPELAEFARSIEQLDGVGGVIGHDAIRASLARAGVGDEEIGELGIELAGTDVSRGRLARRAANEFVATEPVQSVTRSMLVTDDGEHARLAVVLDYDPYTGTAVQALHELRPQMRDALDEAGLEDAKLRVAGDTALVERISIQMNADLLRIAAFLVPFELVVLLLFLRSLLLSVVIVGSGVLTTVGALGFLSIFDRTVGAGDGIAFFVPVSAFVLLLSIGLDYGVLTGSTLRRVRAEGTRGLDGARATITQAYPSVMLAGIVIASTFALLGTVDLDSFRQIAIVMCFGVLVDSLLVRPIVVPLIVAAVDRRAGAGRGDDAT